MNGGHLYIRPGSGKKLISCLKQGKHNTDTTSALKLFSQWIEHTAVSDNETVKVKLLKELIKIFDNIPTTNIQSSTDSAAPSLFLVKIAFEIKKVNITEKTQAI